MHCCGASTGSLDSARVGGTAEARCRTASVTHYGQLPAVTIRLTSPNFALGDAVDSIQALADTTLPSTIARSFQGAAQAFQDSLQGLGLILAAARSLIYIVLGAYESFTHPLTILSGPPRPASAPCSLLIFRPAQPASLSGSSLVGLGEERIDGDFAVKRAAARQVADRSDPRGVSVRFRPIMMTPWLRSSARCRRASALVRQSRRPLGLQSSRSAVPALLTRISRLCITCISKAQHGWRRARPSGRRWHARTARCRQRLCREAA